MFRLEKQRRTIEYEIAFLTVSQKGLPLEERLIIVREGMQQRINCPKHKLGEVIESLTTLGITNLSLKFFNSPSGGERVSVNFDLKFEIW